jgi:hypothetical protein
VPNDNGGVFTNVGASGVVAPYRLRMSEAQPLNHLGLFAAQGSNDSANLVEAVNRCR